MKNTSDSYRSVQVTIISHGACGTCGQLVKELEPLHQKPGITFRIVNLPQDTPPNWAQAFIFPATYVDEKLWRYGNYPLCELEDRLHRKPDETIDN